MTNGSLMKVKSIAECSPWSILQYFWSALRDKWFWKTIFGIFESGRFTQFLLYIFISRSLDPEDLDYCAFPRDSFSMGLEVQDIIRNIVCCHIFEKKKS